MSTNVALARAAVSGTAQLLTLCAFGAYLAFRQVLSLSSCSAWSQAIFNVFLPSLLFVSILETLSQIDSTDFTVYLPALWAVVTFFVSGVVTFIVVTLGGNGVEEGVRRVLFVALLLGNANNLPILLLRSLCDNYEGLRDDETCVSRGVGYVAMFLAAWNTFMWTIVLSYILNTPDDSLPHHVPSSDIPPTNVVVSDVQSLDTNLPHNALPALPQRSRFEKIFSPPLIAIISAAVISHVRRLSVISLILLRNVFPLKL